MSVVPLAAWPPVACVVCELVLARAWPAVVAVDGVPLCVTHSDGARPHG